MTVANNYAPARYVGNGSTRSFAVSWRLENDDDFVVYQKVGGVQSVVDPSNYTAVNTDNEHGVVFNTAPANGTIIVITRATPHEQDTPYKTSSGFQAIKVEEDFDSLTMMVQELQNGVDRAVKVPETSTETQQHFSDSLFAARDQAVASAQAAHESEANAISKAADAQMFAEEAEIHKEDAQDAATIAGQARDNAIAANASAVHQVELAAAESAEAARQAGNAARDADAAEAAERNAATSATNAATSATNASTSATSASTSATNASASAALAEKWATYMDGKVDGNEYSAKYYADLAGQNAGVLTGANKDLSNLTAAGEARFTAKQDVIDSSHKLSASLVSGLAAVATSGAYIDLSGKPSLATVATSGSYNDLSNKPNLSQYALDNAVVKLSGEQEISGTKTFKASPAVNISQPKFRLQSSTITKGTAPASDTELGWYNFEDNAGRSMGRLRYYYNQDKSSVIQMTAYQANSSGDSNSASIRVVYPASGGSYATAPASNAANSILTTIAKNWDSTNKKGYYQLGNGLIIQWGSSDTSGTVTIRFPKAFTTTNYTIVGISYGGSYVVVDKTSKTTSTVSVGNTVGFDWIAIGY